MVRRSHCLAVTPLKSSETPAHQGLVSADVIVMSISLPPITAPFGDLTDVAGMTAVMAQWLGCRTRNHKVASSSSAAAMSSFGDWFTQP